MKNSVWKTFMELSLVRGIVPRTVFGLTAIAAIILIIGLALSKSKKRGRLHPLIVSLIAAVLAGAAVSFAGLLGFVGLIIPHLVRFFVGHDNRLVLPLSAVSGAAFVVVCDLLARVLFAPYEVPAGILMAFLGGPFFIYLILKNRRGSLD